MCLTIDELSPTFTLLKETSHAAPARGDHTDLGAFCTTLFRPHLGPCPAVARGRDADAWTPYGDGRPARDGVGHGAPLHPRPSGVEPGHVVGLPRESDAVGIAHHVATSSGRDDRLRSSCSRGTPLRTTDHGQRLRPRCGALLEEPRHPVFRPHMGRDDARGAGALEPAGVGLAPFAPGYERTSLHLHILCSFPTFFRVACREPPVHVDDFVGQAWQLSTAWPF